MWKLGKSIRNLCVLETGMWSSATADIIVLDRKKLSDANLREGFRGKDSRSWLSQMQCLYDLRISKGTFVDGTAEETLTAWN
jgi:hypothetical protein